MTSRIEVDVMQLKRSLSRLLDDESDESSVLEVLSAIERHPMTLDTLRQTMITDVVRSAKKKLGTSNAGKKATSILALWKSKFDSKKAVPPKAAEAVVQTVMTTVTNPTLKNTMEAPADSDDDDDDDDPDFIQRYKSLSSNRLKAIEMLTKLLKMSCGQKDAKFLAFCIEDSSNSLCNAEDDKKGYTSRVRSLSFNLEKNEKLRSLLVTGMLGPNEFVMMSPQELATEQVKLARAAAQEAGMLGRRSDFYQIKRDEILRANGVDPNAGGDMTCSKCKSTKISYYAMQTRSSDEPMTLFCSCLQCGKRWRG